MAGLVTVPLLTFAADNAPDNTYSLGAGDAASGGLQRFQPGIGANTGKVTDALTGQVLTRDQFLAGRTGQQVVDQVVANLKSSANATPAGGVPTYNASNDTVTFYQPPEAGDFGQVLLAAGAAAVLGAGAFGLGGSAAAPAISTGTDLGSGLAVDSFGNVSGSTLFSGGTVSNASIASAIGGDVNALSTAGTITGADVLNGARAASSVASAGASVARALSPAPAPYVLSGGLSSSSGAPGSVSILPIAFTPAGSASSIPAGNAFAAAPAPSSGLLSSTTSQVVAGLVITAIVAAIYLLKGR